MTDELQFRVSGSADCQGSISSLRPGEFRGVGLNSHTTVPVLPVHREYRLGNPPDQRRLLRAASRGTQGWKCPVDAKSTPNSQSSCPFMKGELRVAAMLGTNMKGPIVISVPLPVFDLSKDQDPLHHSQRSHASLGTTVFLCRTPLHDFCASFRRIDDPAEEVHGASSGPSSDFRLLCYRA